MKASELRQAAQVRLEQVRAMLDDNARTREALAAEERILVAMLAADTQPALPFPERELVGVTHDGVPYCNDPVTVNA